jgi:nicotinate-nucleotide pyrophosphorylase
VRAGLDLALMTFRLIDPAITASVIRVDSSPVAAGEAIATLEGPARGLLAAERVALNFLCHMSGIATATAGVVEAVRGTKARVIDIRKTLPGLRALQKYASRRATAACTSRRSSEPVEAMGFAASNHPLCILQPSIALLRRFPG